ncbi:MAG: gliding motility lipoprotein GldH [Chitinophagaceae bacterium]|nr:gliding motility lipoprotein GldH [Chitinophagaceae bacterium]
MKVKPFLIFNFSLFIVIIFSSCGSIDVYEKTKAFHQQEWSSKDTATFSFDINDTASRYKIYMVLRHGDAYRKKNIWVDITVHAPDSTYKIKREFNLADNTHWLGTAMDDIVEHRISINAQPVALKKGKYSFVLQQAMREDPLEHVLNAGIRVEKMK